MSRLLEYLREDDLRKIVKDMREVSGVEFSLRVAGEEEFLEGPAVDESAPGAVSLDIEVASEPAALLVAAAPGKSPDAVRASAAMLKDIIEEKAMKEMELENLSMEIANNYEEINHILENNNLFAAALEVDPITEITLERALVLTNSSIATLMLYDKEKKTLTLRGRKGGRPGATDELPVPLEGSIWQGVVNDVQPLLIEDVSKSDELDPETYKNLDFGSFAEKSFLSVPLKVKDEAIGVLNVGDKADGFFTSPNVKMLAALAAQSAGSIEKARLYKNIESETRLRSNFQRYLSPTIVEDIIKNNKDLTLGGEVIECSVLFSDICSFTSLAEREKPETIVHMLNEYFSIMTEIIFRYNGTLDKFIGDAIMAIFGAPMFSPDSHLNAVRASLEMHQGLGLLRKKWEAEGLPTFRQRVGINSGLVIAGNIGSPDRMDYTVIGDVVNTASRMESNAKPMTTLISEFTYEKVKDHVKVIANVPLKVKGKAEPMKTYEVVAVMQPQPHGDAARRFLRLGVAISIAVTDEDDATVAAEGMALNVSLGGMLMALPVELRAGANVALEISPDGVRKVKLAGRIVFRKKLKDNLGNVYFHTGVEFNPESASHSQTDLKEFLFS